MKTSVLLIFGLFWVGSSVLAQTAQTTIVVAASGKPTYNRPSKGLQVAPGAMLHAKGKIILKEGDKVLLCSNGSFKTFDKKGTYPLSESADKSTRIATLNFDPLFGQYLNASASIVMGVPSKFKKQGDGWGTKPPTGNVGGWGTKPPTGNVGGWGTKPPTGNVGGWGTKPPTGNVGGWGTKPPTGNVGGWGTKPPTGNVGGWGTKPPTGNVGGWGTDIMTLEPITPGGFYKNDVTNWKWLKTKKYKEYQVCIFNEEQKDVFCKVVQDTTIQVDLKALNLSPEKLYYWQVITADQKQVSPPMDFQILSDADYNDITATPQNSKIYGDADPALKGLMEAVAFEHKKLYLETDQKFESLRKLYPKNDLVKINYAAYCTRLGQTKKAKWILEN